MAYTSKRSNKRDQIILESLLTSPHIGHACEKAGIDRTTLRRWRNEDKDLDAAVTVARDQGAEVLEDELVTRAMDGDTAALIFALKAYRRDKYGDKQQLEHTGKDGGPLVIQIGQREDGPQ